MSPFISIQKAWCWSQTIEGIGCSAPPVRASFRFAAGA